MEDPVTKSKGPGAGAVALALGLVAAAAGIGALVWRAWTDLGDVGITPHGWVALSLGVSLSLALGVGLMALSFYSARRRYDDIHIRED